jgi:hypothetical protein
LAATVLLLIIRQSKKKETGNVSFFSVLRNILSLPFAFLADLA